MAFTALNRLYVVDYPEGTPKRLTKSDVTRLTTSGSAAFSFLLFLSCGHPTAGLANTPRAKQIRQIVALSFGILLLYILDFSQLRVETLPLSDIRIEDCFSQ